MREGALFAALLLLGSPALPAKDISDDLLPGVPQALTKTIQAERFEFRIPLAGWRGPEEIPGGMRFEDIERCAYIEIAYHGRRSGLWKPADAYRKELRQRGSVSDPRVLTPVLISGRFGSRARYTDFIYGGDKLFGETRKVYKVEEIFFPSPKGNYQVLFNSCEEEFERHRSHYFRFLDSLRFPEDPGYRPGKYYERRKELVDDTFGPGTIEETPPSGG